MFATDLERDSNVSQRSDLNERVSDTYTRCIPVFSSDPGNIRLPLKLFVLGLECIALSENGLCLLHGCVPLTPTTRFETLFAYIQRA